MNNKCNVVYVRDLAKSIDISFVKNNLIKETKLSEDQIDSLLASSRAILKKNSPQIEAVKFKDYFDKLGLTIVLEPLPLEEQTPNMLQESSTSKVDNKKKYKVTFTGQFMPKMDSYSVKKNLLKDTKLSDREIDELILSQRVILKEDVNFDEAMDLKKRFAKSGLMLNLELMNVGKIPEPPINKSFLEPLPLGAPSTKRYDPYEVS